MDKKERKALLIADIGYGDAGKGSIVDFLARDTGTHTVIRYNGGAQAAHNVITPHGRHHTFAQFGSASFLAGGETYLSRFMLIHPLAMLAEERHLQSLGVKDAFERTTVDRAALIISPFQQAANRVKELARGDGLHGSCGLGIGETTSDWLNHGADVLFAGDLTDRAAVERKLGWMRDLKYEQLATSLTGQLDRPEIAAEMGIFHDKGFIPAVAEVFIHWAGRVQLADGDWVRDLLRRDGTVIFEGAQGVLLDEWWGFYPYNSWSNLTYGNALTLLAEAGYDGEVTRLGLTRTYSTRHGAGPMVSEDGDHTARLPEAHNDNNAWQHAFRAGPLDLPALRYGLKVLGGVDGLVVTHLDRLAKLPEWRICERYDTSAVKGAERFLTPDGSDLLVPHDPTDLSAQERLTRALMACRPVYREVERSMEKYLEAISTGLGAPVVLTSAGMTAGEKRWVEGLMG
jgi:adenylosuccinate synthase